MVIPLKTYPIAFYFGGLLALLLRMIRRIHGQNITRRIMCKPLGARVISLYEPIHTAHGL